LTAAERLSGEGERETERRVRDKENEKAFCFVLRKKLGAVREKSMKMSTHTP
jgi:hypothetical protein